jgi:hypothetical protein
MATSLFGMSPLDVMERRIQQQAQDNASRRAAQSAAGQSLGIFNPLYQAGLGFSDMAGQATRGLFGAQDPMLMKAAQIQQAMSGKDMNKPEDMLAFSQELAAMGYTAEAMQVAQQARAIDTETFNRRIKLAEFGQSQDKKRKENVDYYKKNPEQAEFRIAQLAETLSADPTNETALQEYNQITRAASEGAIEATQKAQKEELGTDIDKARLAKYRKELEDAQKFGPAERWQAEKTAALTLLRNYNIDPTKPLNKQDPPLPASLLYGPVGGEITKAYERAVRPDVGAPMAVPTPAPAPAPANAAGSPNVESKVKASGIPYEPDKYEYRVLANGTVQRRLK